MGQHALPQPIKLSDSGPPPNANFYPTGKREFYQGTGSPQNVVMGDIGDEYLNIATGEVWRKLSDAGLKSGWVNLTSGQGAMQLDGDGPPTEDPEVLNGRTVYYWDYTNKANYVWDRLEGAWHLVTSEG